VYPILIQMALDRARGSTTESVESACSWVWFMGATSAERDEVDSWLIAIRHTSASEPGTKEYRFRRIVKELAL